MMSLRYIIVRTRLTSDSPIIADSMNLSFLHGIIGGTMRRHFCLLRNAECSRCPLKENCLYIQLIAPEMSKQNTTLPGRVNAPPPLILHRVAIERNEDRITTELDIVLFGKAIANVGHVLGVLFSISERGIGTREVIHPAIESIINVTDGNSPQTLYDGSAIVGMDRLIEGDVFDIGPNGFEGQASLELRFETPLRLKDRGKFQDRPAFTTLLTSIVNRINILTLLYGENGQETRMMVPLDVEKVVMTYGKVVWRENERFSRRQGQSMKLGGIVGEAVLEHLTTDIVQILQRGLIVHAGKNTSFGLGLLSLTARGGIKQ